MISIFNILFLELEFLLFFKSCSFSDNFHLVERFGHPFYFEHFFLLESEILDDVDLTGVSLGLFDSDNAFRIYLYKLVNGSNKWFERLIVTFIAISSI
jgi:hypothetical protein